MKAATGSGMVVGCGAPVQVNVPVRVRTFGEVVVVQRADDGQRKSEQRQRQQQYPAQRRRVRRTASREGCRCQSRRRHRSVNQSVRFLSRIVIAKARRMPAGADANWLIVRSASSIISDTSDMEKSDRGL